MTPPPELGEAASKRETIAGLRAELRTAVGQLERVLDRVGTYLDEDSEERRHGDHG